MLHRTDDLRIESVRPLLPPAILMEELPLDEDTSSLVAATRAAVRQILEGLDDRLVVICGPCSIHDPTAGLEYAERLLQTAEALKEDLLVIMRVYFEKPRTTVGWKGLINDPYLDETYAINEGLRCARRFLIDVNQLGLPAGTEFLDPITPQFLADLVSWGAIGARTTESQVHRELASGLSMPVGFKNGTGGTITVAIDAIRAATHPHHFFGVTKQSMAAIVSTRGNPHCHVILRGGASGTNYQADHIAAVGDALREAGLSSRIMVDCSHANSGKDHARQPLVATDIASQMAGGDQSLFGVMMESFLLDGNQSINSDEALTYGLSITDACMGWERTVPVLEELANAVRQRRRAA